MEMEATNLGLFFLLFSMVAQTLIAEDFDYVAHECFNTTADSIYQGNLDAVLLAITSDTDINYGFYNFSRGQNPNVVNSIALCRGDIRGTPICQRCLNESRQEILRRCPNQKKAIVWYNNCMMRFSNSSIFGNIYLKVERPKFNLDNATDVESYMKTAVLLLNDLRSKAAAGDSRLKFATGTRMITSTSTERVYGLVQCSPDLSKRDCDKCLTYVIGRGTDQHSIIYGKSRVAYYTFSCFVMYQTQHFLQDTEGAAPPPPPAVTSAFPHPSGMSKLFSRRLIL